MFGSVKELEVSKIKNPQCFLNRDSHKSITEARKNRVSTLGKERHKQPTGETRQEHGDTKAVKNLKRGD